MRFPHILPGYIPAWNNRHHPFGLRQSPHRSAENKELSDHVGYPFFSDLPYRSIFLVAVYFDAVIKQSIPACDNLPFDFRIKPGHIRLGIAGVIILQKLLMAFSVLNIFWNSNSCSDFQIGVINEVFE